MNKYIIEYTVTDIPSWLQTTRVLMVNALNERDARARGEAELASRDSKGLMPNNMGFYKVKGAKLL